MSSNGEGEDVGGRIGPIEVSGESAAAVLEIARHLAILATSPDGALKPSAEIQLALRDGTKRAEVLEGLLHEVCPNGADEKLWRGWLAGGASPFTAKVNKVGPGEERPAQTLKRSTPRVRALQSRALKKEEELAAVRDELAYVERYENAAVHWHVVDHLVTLLSPVFAMGPAWTIMRSLSGHLPKEVAENETGFLVGGDKDDAQAGMRASRAKESEAMLDTVDFFSGHIPFEEALRGAVAKVCKTFEAKRADVAKDGRRPRSKERIKGEVHPKAQDDAEAVLDGLKKTG